MFRIFLYLRDIYRNFILSIYRIKLYFCLKKINSFNEKKKGIILIDGIWENTLHWLRLHLVLNGAYRIYGTEFCALIKEKRNFLTNLILNSFKVNEKKELSEKFSNNYKIKANKILKNVNNTKDLFKIQLAYNFPSHIFYDSHLKKNKLATGDFNNKEKLEEDLSIQLYLLDQINSFLIKKKINLFISSHHHGLYYSSIVWLCLRKNIKVFALSAFSNSLSFSILNSKRDYVNMLSDLPKKIDFIHTKQKKLNFLAAKGKKQILDTINNKGVKANLMGSYNFEKKNIKNLKDLNKFLNFKNNNKLIIVYSHAFPDFPNIYGKSWYYDYYQWIEGIIQIAKKFNDYNFLIKPHPAENFYNCFLKDLLKKFDLGENIKIDYRKLPDKKILKFSSLSITGTGSVALEYLSMGKRALLSNLHPFSKISKDYSYNSFANLSNKIKNLNKLKKIDKKTIKKANIYVGLIHYKSQKSLEIPHSWQHYKQTKILTSFIEKNKHRFLIEYKLIEKFLKSKFNRYQMYIKTFN